MPRSLIAGMTDYSYQNLDDIMEDLDDWLESLRQTQEFFTRTLQILAERGYWARVAHAIKALFEKATKFFQTSITEITEIAEELRSEVRQHHVTRLRALAKTASQFNKDFGLIWHSEVNPEDYDNPDFRLLEDLYKQGRGMVGDLQELSNAAGRLVDYIGRAGPVKAASVSASPVIDDAQIPDSSRLAQKQGEMHGRDWPQTVEEARKTALIDLQMQDIDATTIGRLLWPAMQDEALPYPVQAKKWIVRATPQQCLSILESVHAQLGGNRLMPAINRLETLSELVRVSVAEEGLYSPSLIEFQQQSNRKWGLTIYLNESELSAMRVGDPKFRLGINAYFAGETSERCATLCEAFILQLGKQGYVEQMTVNSTVIRGHEVICTGTLTQYHSFMKQETTGGETLHIYGPIQRGDAQTWWVGMSPNDFLTSQQLRQAGVQITDAEANLQLRSEMTLDEIAVAADRTLGANLLRLFKVAEVRASETPKGLRLRFSSGGLSAPEQFWHWIDGLVKKMQAGGFGILRSTLERKAFESDFTPISTAVTETAIQPIRDEYDETWLRGIIRKPELLKVEFKSEYRLGSVPPPNTDLNKWKEFVNGQWDEFIRDVIALANGNVGTALQRGWLIVGVGNDLMPDGTRPIYDSSYFEPAGPQILAKINNACSPPIPDITVDRIVFDEKCVHVITVPPTPHLHETIRQLRTTKGEFDASGVLRFVKEGKTYSPRTAFVRRGEAVEPATHDERRAIENEKYRAMNLAQIDIKGRNSSTRLLDEDSTALNSDAARHLPHVETEVVSKDQGKSEESDDTRKMPRAPRDIGASPERALQPAHRLQKRRDTLIRAFKTTCGWFAHPYGFKEIVPGIIQFQVNYRFHPRISGFNSVMVADVREDRVQIRILDRTIVTDDFFRHFENEARKVSIELVEDSNSGGTAND